MLKRTLLALSPVSGALAAQQPVVAIHGQPQHPEPLPTITRDTVATPAQLTAWLDSTDPRLIAWAATLLREHPDPTVLTHATKLFAQRRSAPHLYNSAEAHADDALLDALVQTDTLAPRSVIHDLHYHSLVESVALLTQLPADQQTEEFQDWLNWNSSEQNGPDLTVAAIYLAQKTQPGIALSLLRRATMELNVTVAKPGETYNPPLGGFGGSCGDSFGQQPAVGWPEIFRYSLERNNNTPDAITVAHTGSEAISLVRYSPTRGFGSCDGVPQLTPYIAYRLLAALLGGDPAWKTTSYPKIEFHSESQFQAELGELITRQTGLFQATVRQLHAHGYLTNEELPQAVPVIKLTIYRSPSLTTNH